MIEMTADSLCHISLMRVLQRTDLDLDLDPSRLSTESGDNSRRPRLGQKPRVKPAVV